MSSTKKREQIDLVKIWNLGYEETQPKFSELFLSSWNIYNLWIRNYFQGQILTGKYTVIFFVWLQD